MNHEVPGITVMRQIYLNTEGSHIKMLLIKSLNNHEDKNNSYCCNKYDRNNNKLESSTVFLQMPV